MLSTTEATQDCYNSSAVCAGQAHSPHVDTSHAAGSCPLKCVSSIGGSGPHLIHGSLEWTNMRQPPNCISIGSVVFAQLTRVPNTQTDTRTTLRATSVAIGPLCAGDAAENGKSNVNWQHTLSVSSILVTARFLVLLI